MIELIMSYRKIYDAIILLNDFKQLMDKNKDKTGITVIELYLSECKYMYTSFYNRIDLVLCLVYGYSSRH